jgi:hypothetical protein
MNPALTTRATTVATAVVVGIAVAFAACGGGDDGDDGATGGASSSPTSRPTGEQYSLVDTVALLDADPGLSYMLEDVSGRGGQLLLQVFKPLDATSCGKLVMADISGNMKTLATDVSQVSFALPYGHAIFSPQGDRVAYLATDDCTNRTEAILATVETATATASRSTEAATRIWSWTFGNTVLYQKMVDGAPALWEAGLDGSSARQVAPGAPIDVSLDGSRMVFASVEGTLSFRSGSNTFETAGTPLDAQRKYLSPDGRNYIYATLAEGNFSGFEVFDLQEGQPAASIDASTLTTMNVTNPASIAWTQDSATFFLQGVVRQQGSRPPAYVMGVDGSVVVELTTGQAPLGTDLRSRGPFLYYRRDNDVFVAVLTGPQTVATEAQTIVTALRTAYREPKRLVFE